MTEVDFSIPDNVVTDFLSDEDVRSLITGIPEIITGATAGGAYAATAAIAFAELTGRLNANSSAFNLNITRNVLAVTQGLEDVPGVAREIAKKALVLDVVIAYVEEFSESGSHARAFADALGTLLVDAAVLFVGNRLLLPIASFFPQVFLVQVLVAAVLLTAEFAAIREAGDFGDSLAEALEAALNLLDPLVIDLDGDGVNTTSVDGSSVTFDLNNDGTEETVGWFEAEDGILFHDWKSITGDVDADGNPIGDGEAQDRSELFATFEELSRHDLNGDGILDARDVAPAPTEDINGDGVIDEQDGQSVTLTGDFDGDGELETIQVGWDQIQVWRDANQNGNVDDGELFSLEELGIESIDLNAEEREIEDNGNLINSESTVTFADGTTRIINGVDLARDTINQSYEQEIANLDLSPLPLAA